MAWYRDRLRLHEPNVLLAYEMQETTGTNAADSSPNGNDGTYVNGVQLAQPPGSSLAKYSTGYTGVSARTLSPAAVWDWTSGGWTVGWQMRFTSLGGTRVQFYSPDGGTGYVTGFVNATGDFLVRIFDGTVSNTNSWPTSLEAGKWYDVVMRIDNGGGLFDLFIDGVKSTPASITAAPAAGNQQIWFGDGNFLAAHNGNLELCAVVNKLLSDVECANLYKENL